MADQPYPHPTSAMRTGPDPSRLCSAGAAGSSSWPNRCRNSGRLAAAWASRASSPRSSQLSPPPDRYAAAIRSTKRPVPATNRAIGVMYATLSTSARTAACAAGNR